MKITIDTKEDSHEDLRKVIKMLQHLVGETPVTNQPNLFEDTAPEVSEGQGDVFGNFFNNEEKQETTPEEPKEETDDSPQIIEY